MSQFFRFPHNFYAGVPRNLAGTAAVAAFGDGNKASFSDALQYRFLTYRPGTSDVTRASRISHIWVRAKGVATYTLSIPAGHGTGSPVVRTMPTEVSANGLTTSILHDGIAHDLFALPVPLSATAIDVGFTGTSVEIYDVMLLDEVLALDVDSRFVKIEAVLENRSATHFSTARGQRFRYNLAPGQSWKWGVGYGARYIGSESYDALLQFMQDNDNFAFAEEYSRFPERVYPATFKNYAVTLQLISRYRGSGTDIYFEIAEI